MYKIIVILSLSLFSSCCIAQNSRYVSKKNLYSNLNGYNNKRAAIDTLKNKLSRDIEKEKQSIQIKYQELVKPYKALQEESLESLIKRFNKLDQEKFALLQQEQKLNDTRLTSYNKQLEEQYLNDIRPYVLKIEEALEKYARKNKVDLIWYLEDVINSLPYYDKSKDITAVIVESVNKTLP